jgi:hypothetical protein
MIEQLKNGQDSPLSINESSFAMKNKEELKLKKLNDTNAEERIINQILGKPANNLMQMGSKFANQLKRLKNKSNQGVIKGKGGRPLLTKLRPQFEVKRIKSLKKVADKYKQIPKKAKKVKKLEKKIKYQNQEIIGKNRQRKGKEAKVDLSFIRKKKIQNIQKKSRKNKKK